LYKGIILTKQEGWGAGWKREERMAERDLRDFEQIVFWA